jgi:hypothetical protein
VEDNYLRLGGEEQEQLRGALARARAEFERAEVRATATEDALLSVPTEAPHDRLLDFASTLRAVIAGRLDGDRSIGELNRALEELFASFTIFRELPKETGRIQVDGSDVGWFSEEIEDALRPDGSLYVFPNLRREVFMRLLAEYGPDGVEPPAPPMEWIEALASSANTHLFTDKPEGVALPVIEVAA